MNLTQSEWDKYKSLYTVFAVAKETKLLISTPDGSKELFVPEEWKNFSDTKSREYIVTKIPLKLNYMDCGEKIVIPEGCIEIGDIILPDHNCIANALDQVDESVTSGDFVKVGDDIHISIPMMEISAIIKNGVMYGMPGFFIGTQVLKDKEGDLYIDPEPTNYLEVKALPYGYTGNVKIGDTVFVDGGTALYKIDSPLFGKKYKDYVRFFVSNLCLVV
jgi:hypothetical protein